MELIAMNKVKNEEEKIKDRMTQKIGVLNRRETEARILVPFIESLSKTFGKAEVTEILSKTIKDLSRKQGKDLALEYGDDVDAFLETLEFWKKDGALEIEVLEKSKTKLNFNVTRCKYAELYKSMGIQELGAIFSCNRDFSMVEGFNEKAKLKREQTILDGSSCCTFRYDFGTE